MKTHATMWGLGLLSVTALSACSGEATQSSADRADQGQAISPKDAVGSAALILDVRTSEEFSTGHLDRAENVPVDEIGARIDEITSKVGGDKSRPVAVYCASGRRAGVAKAALEKAGFTKVTNAGGYEDLKD